VAGPAGEGTWFAFGIDPRDHLPAAREVVAAFRARGIEPDGYVLYAYAAVQAWALAAGRAGTTRAADVAKALHTTGKVATVLGRLAFDAKGDRRDDPYALYRWHDGRTVLLGR
jgi:branched-chain amino acid transport system substrate-binding protein